MVLEKTIVFQQERKKKGNNGTRIDKIGIRNTVSVTGSETIRKTQPVV